MQATTDISDALQAALASLLGNAGGKAEPEQTLQEQVDAAVDAVVGEMTDEEFAAIDEAAAAEPEMETEPEPARRTYYRGRRRGFRRSNTANWIKVEAVTITENVEKNGIEIRFPGKPSDTIRDLLKRRGWKFSGNSGCWYHKATDTNRAYAKEIKALADGNWPSRAA